MNSALRNALAGLAILALDFNTGKLRWYAAWIAGGSAIFVAIVMFL